MKSMTRKTMLYKTGVEYGDYTMNHAFGCAHGCKYPCYAFLQKRDLVRFLLTKNGLSLRLYPIHWTYWILK